MPLCTNTRWTRRSAPPLVYLLTQSSLFRSVLVLASWEGWGACVCTDWNWSSPRPRLPPWLCWPDCTLFQHTALKPNILSGFTNFDVLIQSLMAAELKGYVCLFMRSWLRSIKRIGPKMRTRQRGPVGMNPYWCSMRPHNIKVSAQVCIRPLSVAMITNPLTGWLTVPRHFI